MKNKKIIVSLLVVVLVLSAVAACFAGCDKSNWKEIDSSAMTERMYSALNNMENYDLLNNIEMAANINVDTEYGSSKNSYNVAVAAKLALWKGDDNKNALSFVVKNNNDDKTELGVYYDESKSSNVYFVAGDNKLALKGLNVKQVIKDKDATINNEWCEGAKTTVTDFISTTVVDTVLSMVASIGKCYQSKDGSTIRIELPLTSLLTDKDSAFASFISDETLNPIFEDLGIDLKASQLAEVLPKIVISLDFKFKGTGESSELAGIAANLSCDKKNLVINKANNGGTLLQINVKENFKATVSGDIFISPETTMVQQKPGNDSDYKKVNALNAKATGEVYISEDITANVDLGAFKMNMNIPKGTYDITLAIDADPTKLVDMSFDKGDSVHDTIDLVGNVLNQAIDYFLIQVTNKETKEDLIKLELVDEGDIDLLTIASLKADALGINELVSVGEGQEITTLINIIKGFITDTVYPTEPSEGEGSGTPSGDITSGTESGTTSGTSGSESGDTVDVMSVVAGYIKNACIILDAGKLSVELKNTAITEQISLGAGIIVDSNGVTIDATIGGLDSIMIGENSIGLPASINAKITFTSFSLGNARG